MHYGINMKITAFSFCSNTVIVISHGSSNNATKLNINLDLMCKWKFSWLFLVGPPCLLSGPRHLSFSAQGCLLTLERRQQLFPEHQLLYLALCYALDIISYLIVTITHSSSCQNPHFTVEQKDAKCSWKKMH
jgi:hypothetical protein